MKFLSPADITPGTKGSFQDVDLTSNFGADAGSVSFALLEVVNNSSSDRNWGAQKNGSSDDLIDDLEASCHTWVGVPVDGDDILELLIENQSTTTSFFLIGYATTAEAGNLTNADEMTVSADDEWVDLDISSNTGADTAIVAFFQVRTNNTREYGFRQNGSTDTRRADFTGTGTLNGAMMSCDGVEIMEVYQEARDHLDFHLSCWLTANATNITNATEHSATASGSYLDTDMSADIVSGETGAFLQSYGGLTGVHMYHIRNNGESDDHFKDSKMGQYLWMGIDADRTIEQKIEDTARNTFLFGHTAEPSAAAVADSFGLPLVSVGR